MRVRLHTSRVSGSLVQGPGDVVEVPDREGLALLETGQAEILLEGMEDEESAVPGAAEVTQLGPWTIGDQTCPTGRDGVPDVRPGPAGSGGSLAAGPPRRRVRGAEELREIEEPVGVPAIAVDELAEAPDGSETVPANGAGMGRRKGIGGGKTRRGR